MSYRSSLCPALDNGPRWHAPAWRRDVTLRTLTGREVTAPTCINCRQPVYRVMPSEVWRSYTHIILEDPV